jgi:hypothetical protein
MSFIKAYVESIASRLAQFSDTLTNTSLFVENPWVFLDEDSNHHKYIFRRSGELLVAVNGDVSFGNWEFLSAANSIMIDNRVDKVLLNALFIDKAIMILKKDGPTGELILLANQNIIHDLDVQKYLRGLYYKRFSVYIEKLPHGRKLEILSGYDGNFLIGKNVTIDGFMPLDGDYKIENSEKIYRVAGGAIKKLVYVKIYTLKNGDHITIEQQSPDAINLGDKVIINDQKAPNGDYRLASNRKIIVNDGFIQKVKSVWFG